MNPKPGPLMLMGGGLLAAIGTFLDWRDILGFSSSGVSTDSAGLQGIFVLLIGLALAAYGAILQFAPQVDLPDEVLGFTNDQVALTLGFAAFLIAFGFQFADFTGPGVFLSWIGAAVAVVGAVLNLREASAPAAPSSF